MMRLALSTRRTAALVALVAIAGPAAFSGIAGAASISTPQVIRPGATIPVDFPGYEEPASNRLPGGHRIVKRTARLARGERSTVVMTAPQGFRIVTFAVGARSEVGFAALDRSYPGRRSTRIRLYSVGSRLAPGETGSGAIHLLARRA
jgi:hypothetical protein